MRPPEGHPMSRLRWPFVGLPIMVGMLAGAILIDNQAISGVGVSGTDMLWAAGWLGFPLVGAIILSRRGHHPIGWIMYAIGGCLTLGLFANSVAVRHAFVEPVPVVGGLATWLAFWVMIPAFGLPSLFLLLFPTGRATGRWRSRFTRLVAANVALIIVVSALRPRESVEVHGLVGEHLRNPLGIEPLAGVLDATHAGLTTVATVFTFLAMLDAVRRMIWGAPVERRQLRWVAIAVVPFPVLMTAASLVAGGAHNDALVAVAFFVSFQGVAAAVLVAITRYRLYEIDRVVSRALSWTIITAALVGLYLGGVLLVSQVLRPLGASGDLAVAASTLVVAAAFNPLRRRVQGVVDRRFNRERYDAAKTVEAFRSRLRTQVDLADIEHDVLAAVRTSVAPSSTTLWLRPQGAPR